MSEQDAAVRLMRDAYERWERLPAIELAMTRQDAWVLMVGLQTAVAHPLLAGGPMAKSMEAVGRRIQDAVCDDPEVYTLAESAWNRAFHVAPDRSHEVADDPGGRDASRRDGSGTW